MSVPHSVVLLTANQVVSFGEVAYINDMVVRATAEPSGEGIGCAFWVISTSSCRYVQPLVLVAVATRVWVTSLAVGPN